MLQKVLEVNIVGEVKIVLQTRLYLLLIHLPLREGKQWTHHTHTSQASMPFVAEDWNVTLFGSCSNGGGKKGGMQFLVLKPDRLVRSRGRSGMGSNIAWHRRHNDSVD